MYIKCVYIANNLQVRFVLRDVSRLLFMLVTRPNLLVNKLDYSCVLTCDFVRISFRSRATRKLYAKINGKHASMVHASVKFKLSCTVGVKTVILKVSGQGDIISQAASLICLCTGR